MVGNLEYKRVDQLEVYQQVASWVFDLVAWKVAIEAAERAVSMDEVAAGNLVEKMAIDAEVYSAD